MVGITMLLMAIADYRVRRKNKKRMRCDVCKARFDTFEAAEEHRRRMHGDVAG
jgi:transcriptional regulator NrdR family protein